MNALDGAISCGGGTWDALIKYLSQTADSDATFGDRELKLGELLIPGDGALRVLLFPVSPDSGK